MHGNIGPTPTAAALAGRPDFRIGDCRISPSRHQLRGPLGTVPIEPRVMQVLVALADAGGEVVAREVLMARCWPSQTVGDDALSRTIFEIRRAARAAGAVDFAIETVPKTGYRIKGAIAPAGIAGRAGDDPSDEVPRALDNAIPAERVARALAPSRRALIAAGAVAVSGVALWRSGSAMALQADAWVDAGDSAMRDLDGGGDDSPSARAARLYREAIACSPDSARAWGRLALAERERAREPSPATSEAAILNCRSAANRALGMDPDQADAAAAIASLPRLFGDWQGARQRLEAVLTRHPGHPETTLALIELAIETGAFRLAQRRCKRLRNSDPGSLRFRDAALSADWAARDTAAFGDDLPGLPPARTFHRRALMLVWNGRPAAALAVANAVTGKPAAMPPQLLAALRATLAAADSNLAADRARAVTACLAVAEHGHIGASRAMLWLGSLGATDPAFAIATGYYLQKGSIKVRYNSSPWADDDWTRRSRTTQPLCDPLTASMRADPRFLPLVRDIGLLDYWRTSGDRPDFLGDRPLPV